MRVIAGLAESTHRQAASRTAPTTCSESHRPALESSHRQHQRIDNRTDNSRLTPSLTRIASANPVPATGPHCDGAHDRVTLGSRECDPSSELRRQRAQPRGSPGPSRAVRRSLSVASTGIRSLNMSDRRPGQEQAPTSIKLAPTREAGPHQQLVQNRTDQR